MKKLIPFFASILLVSSIFGQTDELNFKKYWKFRDKFRENFIKIGSQDGESLPAGRRNPGACIDNIDFAGDEGWVNWGDRR